MTLLPPSLRECVLVGLLLFGLNLCRDRLTIAKSCRQLADLEISCYLLQNSQSILTPRVRDARGAVVPPGHHP